MGQSTTSGYLQVIKLTQRLLVAVRRAEYIAEAWKDLQGHKSVWCSNFTIAFYKQEDRKACY